MIFEGDMMRKPCLLIWLAFLLGLLPMLEGRSSSLTHRTCSFGKEKKNYGIDIEEDDLDVAKFIGTHRAKSANDCARFCCMEKFCSMSWFMNDNGINCFLLNCSAPHVCDVKESGMGDSVIEITRIGKKKNRFHEEQPVGKKKDKPPTTTSVTSVLLSAVQNKNLKPKDLKSIVASFKSLGDADEIESIIDDLLLELKTSTVNPDPVPEIVSTPHELHPNEDDKVSEYESTAEKTEPKESPTSTELSRKVATTTTTQPTTITKPTTTTTTEPTTTTTTKPTTTTTKPATTTTKPATTTTKPTTTTTGPPTTTVTTTKPMTATSTLTTTTITTKKVTDASVTSIKSLGSRPPWMQPRAGLNRTMPEVSMADHFRPPKLHVGLLLAACIFGVVGTLTILIMMQRRVRNAWRKKDYSEADFLINGMYQPSTM